MLLGVGEVKHDGRVDWTIVEVAGRGIDEDGLPISGHPVP